MADSEERKGQRTPAAPSRKTRAPVAPSKKGRASGTTTTKARKATVQTKETPAPVERAKRVPQNHRTIDRVTRILEEVVYNPGMTFAELVRALDAAKSSVHGFISGLLANGWLYQEQHRFYLGPAVYGLTMASGHIRAGLVTHEDLVALEKETGVAAFLGVQAGDHLIYIAEAGSDHVTGFEARSNIRRTLLITAGGKALLTAGPRRNASCTCVDEAPKSASWSTVSSRNTTRSSARESRPTLIAGGSPSPQPCTTNRASRSRRSRSWDPRPTCNRASRS